MDTCYLASSGADDGSVAVPGDVPRCCQSTPRRRIAADAGQTEVRAEGGRSSGLQSAVDRCAARQPARGVSWRRLRLQSPRCGPAATADVAVVSTARVMPSASLAHSPEESCDRALLRPARALARWIFDACASSVSRCSAQAVPARKRSRSRAQASACAERRSQHDGAVRRVDPRGSSNGDGVRDGRGGRARPGDCRRRHLADRRRRWRSRCSRTSRC